MSNSDVSKGLDEPRADGGGFVIQQASAYCNDTEGNIFGIFQPDGNAK